MDKFIDDFKKEFSRTLKALEKYDSHTDDLFDDISAWQRETFPDATHINVMTRLREEFVEFLEAESNGKKDEMILELADVVILAIEACKLNGKDLRDVVREKHEINLKREWHKDGRHVYEEK